MWFRLLIVLAKLSVLAKWLARKTPLRKPNHGEVIVSTNLKPKSFCDFLGLFRRLRFSSDADNVRLTNVCIIIIMRPSSLGGGRILRRTLSVRLSVGLSVCPVIITERHVAPPSELQWHTCKGRISYGHLGRTNSCYCIVSCFMMYLCCPPTLHFVVLCKWCNCFISFLMRWKNRPTPFPGCICKFQLNQALSVLSFRVFKCVIAVRATKLVAV